MKCCLGSLGVNTGPVVIPFGGILNIGHLDSEIEIDASDLAKKFKDEVPDSCVVPRLDCKSVPHHTPGPLYSVDMIIHRAGCLCSVVRGGGQIPP